MNTLLLTNPISLSLFFLLWGSFLNVVGLRLVTGTDIILKRSRCPRCDHVLAWYDLIPILSWLMLRAHCRYCHNSISSLYPLFELLTALLCSSLFFYFSIQQACAYTVLTSALIASSRSDLETQLISRWTSLYIVPIGLLFSWFGWSNIMPYESLLGVLLGFAIPYAVVRISRYIYSMDGLGIGDCDLLALIGSFLGPGAAWASFFLGALLATTIAIPFLCSGHLSRKSRIPFGPFIALGAYIALLAGPYLLDYIIPIR